MENMDDEKNMIKLLEEKCELQASVILHLEKVISLNEEALEDAYRIISHYEEFVKFVKNEKL